MITDVGVGFNLVPTLRLPPSRVSSLHDVGILEKRDNPCRFLAASPGWWDQRRPVSSTPLGLAPSTLDLRPLNREPETRKPRPKTQNPHAPTSNPKTSLHDVGIGINLVPTLRHLLSREEPRDALGPERPAGGRSPCLASWVNR